MKISVIIPVYNSSEYLGDVINSICRSGLNDYEIIIVDDGSEDETELVLKEIIQSYKAIRVIRQENSGVSAARNRGLRESTGDYILFVDADDLIEENSLWKINEIIDQGQPDMILFGMHFDYYFKDKLYRSDEYLYPKSGYMDVGTAVNEFEELFESNMLSPVWNKMIKREMIISNQIRFCEDMIEMEDYLFSARCLSESNIIYLLDKAAYRYRQAEDERGTFRRLWRIESLSAYVDHFYEAIRWFEKNDESSKVDAVADRIYATLFHEQLRFASVKQIRIAAEDMLSGTRPDVIAKADPDLYDKLEKKRYLSVWMTRTLARARHWTAIRLKYLIGFWR